MSPTKATLAPSQGNAVGIKPICSAKRIVLPSKGSRSLTIGRSQCVGAIAYRFGAGNLLLNEDRQRPQEGESRRGWPPLHQGKHGGKRTLVPPAGGSRLPWENAQSARGGRAQHVGERVRFPNLPLRWEAPMFAGAGSCADGKGTEIPALLKSSAHHRVFTIPDRGW